MNTLFDDRSKYDIQGFVDAYNERFREYAAELFKKGVNMSGKYSRCRSEAKSFAYELFPEVKELMLSGDMSIPGKLSNLKLKNWFHETYGVSVFELEEEEEEETDLFDEDVLPTELYRRWCKENDYVHDDYIWSFLTHRTRSLFTQVRKSLKQVGYSFEKDTHGWFVTKTPYEPVADVPPAPIDPSMLEKFRMFQEFEEFMKTKNK